MIEKVLLGRFFHERTANYLEFNEKTCGGSVDM